LEARQRRGESGKEGRKGEERKIMSNKWGETGGQRKRQRRGEEGK